MTCPTCDGAKVLRGLGKPSDGGPCRYMEFQCYDCGGSGEVPDARAVWQREGETLRRFREVRDLDLRRAAHWAGILPSAWSDAEHGKVDPGELIGLVQKLALARAARRQ